MRDGLRLLLGRLIAVLAALEGFARRDRGHPLPRLHPLPAGAAHHRRQARDALDAGLRARRRGDLATGSQALRFRGCQGTTGTQASFLELFGGDHGKVRELERRVTGKLGFPEQFAVTGQTYPRKADSMVLDALSGVAQSAAKMAGDLRLLQHEGELLEPFEAEQIGSSAMAYKRNPMRAERIAGLARFVISLQANGAHTAASQWLERTLDDSANRRLTLPEAFLGTDAILVLATNIAAGLEVREDVIRRHVAEQMPFMATERWLMLGVGAGGDAAVGYDSATGWGSPMVTAMAEAFPPCPVLVDGGSPPPVPDAGPAYVACEVLGCDGGIACTALPDGPSTCLIGCNAQGANTCPVGNVCTGDSLFSTSTSGECISGCEQDSDCALQPGTACSRCTRLCVPTGSATAQYGDECTNDSQCPNGAICNTSRTFAGGYCTVACNPSVSSESACGCPAGTQCGSIGRTIKANLCLASCDVVGDLCARPGYYCQPQAHAGPASPQMPDHAAWWPAVRQLHVIGRGRDVRRRQRHLRWAPPGGAGTRVNPSWTPVRTSLPRRVAAAMHPRRPDSFTAPAPPRTEVCPASCSPSSSSPGGASGM